MTTHDEITAFLKARMAERSAKGLRIVILVEDEPCTLHPKDQATKQRWLDGYARKGIVVVES